MKKSDSTRIPLIQAGAILLVFVLLAYLTGTSAEGSVFKSLGILIVGCFQLIWFLIGMSISIVLCLAFLIGIFFLAAWLADRTSVIPLYASLRQSLQEQKESLSFLSCLPCCSRSVAASDEAPVAGAVDPEAEKKEALRKLLTDELAKITRQQQEQINQQAAQQSAQLAALQDKLHALEAKGAEFAAAAQLDSVNDELASFRKALADVQTQAANLSGKVQDTVQQIGAMTPEKMLGDLPERIGKLEEQGADFAPAALTESVAALQQEVEKSAESVAALQKELEESKKKPAPRSTAKPRTRKKPTT
ncbi:MAG: hypothetical protein ACOX5Z_06670 [Desulfobulbus sp.]|jgi:uncharacterized coiled-coil protein SlyX